MSYTALYRKFRPDNFDEVKGQDHIVTVLKNQVSTDRIGHAYLFCGTRGTGKTSVAKVLAKAVNCENPVNGNPCNECAICKAIKAQTSMNVIEIDAASNNGVENIRDIIEEVRYSPTEGKYKVYIIDEVHMLSTSAFNALLKTLEEPPSYVVFILATTEAHKIPVTIMSRCQRYNFKRISNEMITSHLAELCKAENIEADDKALRYIAGKADGAFRDAISLLDQCISFCFGQALSYERVLEILGAVDIELFARLQRYIRKGSVVECIEVLDSVVNSGRDITQFISDYVWYMRNLLLVKTSAGAVEILEISPEQTAMLAHEAEASDANMLIRDITVFSELCNTLRRATQKRVLVELTIIRSCCPQTEVNEDALIERVRRLEECIENGASFSREAENSEPEEELPDIIPEALPEEVKQVAANWKTLITDAEMPSELRIMLSGAVPSVVNNRLHIYLQNKMDGLFLDTPGNKEKIEEVIEKRLKCHVDIEFEVKKMTEKARRTVDISRLKGLQGIKVVSVD